MHCVTVFSRCSKVLNAANNDVSLFFGWVYTINKQENCMTTSESKGRFFLQNESIRIDSRNESNRIDSNRELECSSQQQSRRSTACSSKCGQCHVVSWRRKLHTYSYLHCTVSTACLSVCLSVQSHYVIDRHTDTRSQRTTLYHRFNRSSLSVVIFLCV